jgi:hypothetical protein
MSTDPYLTAALDAVARGFRVFPLRPGTKRPALHAETRCPRTGPCQGGHQTPEQRSLIDPDEVRWYWTSQRYAGCNVGIATGPSGLVVVDLDTPKSPADVPPQGWSREGIRDGHDVFAAVCAEAGHPVPWETRTVRTARGGTHLYFRAPAGIELRNTEGDQGTGLGWKVDTRAWGGYVVGPGSTTVDGDYRLTEDVAPIDLPGWLVQALTPRPPLAKSAPPVAASDRLPGYVSAAVRGECDRVAAAQSGAHTRTLFVASVALGQLVGGGLLPSATAEARLYAAATHMITDRCGCTDREVLRTIANGLRAGISRPRTAPAERPAHQLALGGAA